MDYNHMDYNHMECGEMVYNINKILNKKKISNNNI